MSTEAENYILKIIKANDSISRNNLYRITSIDCSIEIIEETLESLINKDLINKSLIYHSNNDTYDDIFRINTKIPIKNNLATIKQADDIIINKKFSFMLRRSQIS
jgi:hypothetical protein